MASTTTTWMLRVGGGHRREQQRHEPAAGGADHAEADVAGDVVRRRGHVGDQRVELGLDAPGPGDDELAGLGEPAVAAVDQGDAQLALEAGDVGRHVRLDGVQGPGRGREAAVVGHGGQGGELAEVHRST